MTAQPQTHVRCLAAAILGAAFMEDVRAQPYPSNVSAATLMGNAAGDNFGKSVAGAGDINGDGLADVVVGAPYAFGLATASGRAFVYFGSPVFFDTQPDGILNGQGVNDHFGISAAADMDLNNDGFADVAVGARLSDVGATDGGAVFVYFGGPTFGLAAPLMLPGQAGDDWFGQSVRSAGDVNGDGFDDLVVGAPYNDANGNAAGRAYVYLGGNPMDVVADVILQGATQTNSHFGWSVSGAGDVNNDGFDDVIVGSRLYGGGPNQARGRAYIFFGGNPMNSAADVLMDGENANDWFGESVSNAGDVNGDGFDDVIVGAIYADPPSGSAAGKSYVYFGGNPMNTITDLAVAGPEADAQLGNSVAAADDLNGDGFADVIVGAHFADASTGLNAGKALVYFGAPAPDSAVDVTFFGSAASDQCGESVGAGGHLSNGVAFSFLVGAHYNDQAGNGAGKAYVAHLAVSCPPDIALPHDGQVNIDDLLLVINNWGQGSGNIADVTGNGNVDIDDLLAVINAWGPCP